MPGTPAPREGLRRQVVLTSQGAATWRMVPESTPQPPTIPSDSDSLVCHAWPYIVVFPNGDLRRWERTRSRGWMLVDATKPKEFVVPFDLDDESHWDNSVSQLCPARGSVSPYRGIPYTGRRRTPSPDIDDIEDEVDRTTRTVETQTEVYDCDVTLTSVVEKTPSPSSVAVVGNTGHVEPEDIESVPGSPISPHYDPESPTSSDFRELEKKEAGGVTGASEPTELSEIEKTPPISEDSTEEDEESGRRRKRSKLN